MLIVIFVSSPGSKCALLGSVKPGPDLFEVFLCLSVIGAVCRAATVGIIHE